MKLLPLDCSGGFGGYIVDDAVDMAALVGDAVGDFGEDIVGDSRPIGGHKVVGGDGANDDDVIVGTVVAHNSDGVHAGEDAEELRQLAFVAVFGHLVAQHPIGVLQNPDLFGGDFAQNTDSEAGAREGLTPDEFLRDPQLFADLADLVLEQVAERLDSAEEADVGGLFNHIVVGLDDGGAGLAVALALARLDPVGVDSALREEAVLGAGADLVPEHLIELGADYFALLLGVGDALEALHKVVAAVDADKVHIEQACERPFDEVALVLAHEPLVDENAGQLLADGTAEKSCGDGGVDSARKAEDHVFVADLFAQRGDGVFDKIVHNPVARAAADLIEEVVQHPVAELGVGDLGMELDGVDPFRLVLHRGAGTVVGLADDPEALGRGRDIVGVAHPDGAFLGHVSEQL